MGAASLERGPSVKKTRRRSSETSACVPHTTVGSGARFVPAVARRASFTAAPDDYDLTQGAKQSALAKVGSRENTCAYEISHRSDCRPSIFLKRRRWPLPIERS